MNEQAQNEQAQIDGKRRRLTRRTMLPLVVGSILLLVALAQCMLLGAFLGGLNSPLAARDNTLLLSYSDFQAQVAAGNVAWVTIDTTGADITGGLRHPISGTTGQGPTVTSDRVSTIYPFADTASLRSQLQAHGVEIRTAPPDSATNGPPALLVSALVCGGAVLAAALGLASLFLAILRLMHPGIVTSDATPSRGG